VPDSFNNRISYYTFNFSENDFLNDFGNTIVGYSFGIFLFKNGTWYVSQYGKTFLLSDFLNDASIHWDNLMQRHGKCKYCEKESELRAQCVQRMFSQSIYKFL